jgi:hypothetical protein
MPVSNKGRLGLGNIIGEMMLQPVSQRFSNNFVDYITEANRSIVLRISRLVSFRNESYISLIKISGHMNMSIEVLYRCIGIIFNP